MKDMEATFPFPAVKTKLVFLPSRENVFSRITKSEKYSLLVDKNLLPHLPVKMRKRAFPLPGGEACKNWKTLGAVLAWLAAKNTERSETLFVIGGGAACDLGALAAALYRRGMPLTLVPTTLLAQLDASVGGKCAVDFIENKKRIKNFAGAFYPANQVLISPSFLESLPARERRSGLGELLKMLYLEGVEPDIASMQLFLANGKMNASMQRQVQRAIAAKIGFVRRDPLDTKRIREALNFGHTVGHALESMAGGEISHGEAVAFGLFFEVAFAESKRELLIAQRVYGDLMRLQFRLPEKHGSMKAKDWERHFLGDKKMNKSKLAMSIALAKGKIIRLEVAPNQLAQFMAGAFPALVQLGKVHPPA